MTRTVALLVFPGVQSLDVSGPLDVFEEANRFLPPESRYRLLVLGTETGPMACSNGLLLQAHQRYDTWTEPLDLLLVAGGPRLVEDDLGEPLHAWLRGAVRRARRYGSICNGTFVLARAGLLEGRTVATHWSDAEALARLCPSTQVEADRLFVQDGALHTSAGVTAGIDLSLHLLTQDHGHEVTLNVAKRLVIFTQRAGGQSQFSPYLVPHAEPLSPVAQVQAHVLAHLADPLDVAALAEVARMSPRNFARVFAREARITPAEFVERARVDAARAMLERGDAPLKTVAWTCGFGAAPRMRAAFQKRFGVSPQQYRQHFGQAGGAASAA